MSWFFDPGKLRIGEDHITGVHLKLIDENMCVERDTQPAP